MPRQAVTVLVTLAALAAAESSVHAQRIYWTGDGGVRRAYLDGSNAELVVPTGGIALAVDLTEARIYFNAGLPGKIQCANLDGSGIEEVVTSNVHAVLDIELDLLHREIYWIDSTSIQGFHVVGVFRADLDDVTNAEVVFPYSAESYLNGIALDPQAGYLYWTYASSSFQGILRRSLNGPPTEQLITEGLVAPSGIALDLLGGTLYFTDGWIMRANLDGSELGPVLQHNGIIRNLALDLRRGKVYWNDYRNITVYRANLDGSEPEPLMPRQPNTPFAIAIDDRVYFDCNNSGESELDDRPGFIHCLVGPGLDVTNACLCADENGDRDVDLADFAAFQRIFGAEE